MDRDFAFVLASPHLPFPGIIFYSVFQNESELKIFIGRLEGVGVISLISLVQGVTEFFGGSPRNSVYF